MEQLRYAAFVSIGRAVGFSAFAILTVMLGLSFEPILALQSGGVLLLVLLVGLLLKAQRAHSADHRHSEAWLLVSEADRPDDRYARAVMGVVLRDACLWFARWTAGAAALVWATAFLLNAFGAGPDLAA